MVKKKYKHDKVIWDKATQKFLLKWEDAVKALKGGNKHQKSTRVWSGKGKPTKEQVESKKAELLREIEELEARLREEAEAIQFGRKAGADDLILVHEWFSNLPDSELCHKADATDEAKRKRRRTANALAEWALKFYPDLYLHEVRERHIKEFFNWRKDNQDREKRFRTKKKKLDDTPSYSWGSLDGERKIIQRFFKEICKRFIDSKLPYRNPVEDYKTNTVVAKRESRYSGLSPEQMRSLYSFVDEAKGYTKGDYKLQLKALVYFHLITGWRTEQICTLEWSSIDFKSRTISVVHHKTEEDGTRTIIQISDKMHDILTTLKNKFKNHPLNKHPEQVFGLRKHSGGKMAVVAQMKAYFRTWREKMELTSLKLDGYSQIHSLCVQSIRGSVITELSIEKFNHQQIDYLVGHSNGSINSNHYLTFEEQAIRATKGMIAHMEKVIGAKFWNESARIESELKEQAERVKEARGKLAINQGGILFDIDPRTGKQIQISLQTTSFFNKTILFIHGRFFGISFFLI